MLIVTMLAWLMWVLLDSDNSESPHLRVDIANEPGQVDIGKGAVIKDEHHEGISVIGGVAQPMRRPLGRIPRVPLPQETLLVHPWFHEHARLQACTCGKSVNTRKAKHEHDQGRPEFESDHEEGERPVLSHREGSIDHVLPLRVARVPVQLTQGSRGKPHQGTAHLRGNWEVGHLCDAHKPTACADLQANQHHPGAQLEVKFSHIRLSLSDWQRLVWIFEAAKSLLLNIPAGRLQQIGARAHREAMHS